MRIIKREAVGEECREKKKCVKRHAGWQTVQENKREAPKGRREEMLKEEEENNSV